MSRGDLIQLRSGRWVTAETLRQMGDQARIEAGLRGQPWLLTPEERKRWDVEATPDSGEPKPE